jgi:hypothetical protein
MTSVAHNGFGCPYCRTAMAEEPEEEEESVWEDEDEEEEEEEMIDDNGLRGFRFFWNNLNGQEHDEDDDADEQQMEEWEERALANIPSASFVAQKLEQQGVSYEQIVKVLLLNHEEFSEDETIHRIDGEIFGKIRILLSNYTPEQAVTQPVVVQEPVVQPVIAEPKIYSRRIMTHV